MEVDGTARRYAPGTLAAPLAALALCAVLGSTIADLYRAREGLARARVEQEQALEVAPRVERQLDALATGTRRLAEEGNPNARRVLGVLRANGVNVNAR